MNNFSTNSRAKTFFNLSVLVFAIFAGVSVFAQGKTAKKKSAPPIVATNPAVKVTQIDDAKLKELVKPNGKPLLVNFWATWCDPCREEFPDLVKIENDYRGKIDVITISLDDITDINTGVPKFLTEMKAEMPTYLLVSNDEGAVISTISKDWNGGLPFTILYDEKGETIYFKQGKFNTETLKSSIEKSLTDKTSQESNLELQRPKIRSTEDGRQEAKNDIAKGILRIKRYGLTSGISQESLDRLKRKYNIEITEHGCILLYVDAKYFQAYNETMKSEMIRRYGSKILKEIAI